MLQNKLQLIQQQIAIALKKRTESKVTGDKVTLVAVTKNHPVDLVLETLATGITNIGENRVQEAKEKRQIVQDVGIWHLIGHLQTNKVKQAVTFFDLIESVDSMRLLEEINKAAKQQGKRQEILLQLNIAGELQKTGFTKTEYEEILPQLDKFTHLHIRGLMIIAPLCENIEETRPVFQKGYRAFSRLKQMRPEIDILSMGMSNDYLVAIEEGANVVRIGTALFGKRDYNKNN